MTGPYTCIATHTFSGGTVNNSVHITISCEYVNTFLNCKLLLLSVNCEAVQSTELIIVNMTSTAMGSIATYQCRDGPTDDVYTTQCSSAGVWDPHPLSHLNCTKPTESTTPSSTDPTTNTEPTSISTTDSGLREHNSVCQWN